mgnify:FL=1
MRWTRVTNVSEPYRRGDVFWAPDPFREGTNPRLWLVLAGELLPFPDQEYICVALTTSDLPGNDEIGSAWLSGKHPDKTSYCSPWVLATIKDRTVVDPQGTVAPDFADRMAAKAIEYLES